MTRLPVRFDRIAVGIDSCYLLRGGKNILIDGGAPRHVDTFARALERLEVDPKSIELIVLTHGHADHIGSLHGIQRLTAAKVAAHRHDCHWVEDGCPPLPPGVTTWGKVLIGLGTYLYTPEIIPCKVDQPFGDEGFSLAEYGIPGRVLHTPGHSSGSSCVLLETGEVFAGDMAMNAWFLRSTPGLPVLAEDMSMVLESWRRMIRLGAKRVYPAHGLDFPIAVIQKELAKEFV